MQSGCPHSQGGAYPAFQHRSNIGGLTSPQDNNVTPEPVAHPANGKQNKMIAIPYSTELRVGYNPAQWQQGYAPSPQNFPELHHQQESQASIGNTGFQHPLPRDSACTSQNSHCQISRKVNDDFDSSAHVSAQYSSYFGTFAYENSVRQSVYNSGQQKECSNHNFSRHSLEGSNLNKNNRLLQRNCAFLASTSSAVFQGDSLGVAAKTVPSQQCSSVPESKQQSSFPMLRSLLTGNPPDFKSFSTTPYSSSEKTNSDIELNASAHLSDERHCKGWHMRSSLPALNCGQTRTQNPNQSGGTHPTLHQQQVCSPSLRGQPSTDKVLPAGETEPPTDDQIQNFIAKQLAYFRTVLTQKRSYGHTLSNKGGNFCTNDRDSTLQSDCTMPKSNSIARPSTVSDKDVEKQSPNRVVVVQCTAAVGQELEEDSSKGSKAKAELTPKSKELGDCTTSASENHSTEYPQIMVNVAATCIKNEDESPVIGITLDELTERHPSLMVNCSLSQKQCKNLDDIDQEPDVSGALKHMTAKERGFIGLKPVEAVGLDSVQGVTDVSEDLPPESGSENEVKEQALLSESVGEEVLSLKILKDPQYEDISDDDLSQLSTELPKTEHEELSFPTCFEDPQYEDISEDENSQIENPSLAQVPEPNNKQSLFENEGYRQGRAQMKTEIISVKTLIPKKLVSPKTEILDAAGYCFCPYFVETDYGFEGLCPKCGSERHLARQTNHSVSHSPSNVLKYEDQTEDQMDDDWIVIPISVSDLNFGPEDEDQDGPEEVVLDDGENGDNERQGGTSPTHFALHCPAPASASASSQLEVYDTIEIFFRQVKGAPGRSIPEHEMDSEEEPHTPQKRRESYSEPEDSCETEDSCDYSSASEHNYLTVPRQLLKRSATLPPERYSVSEKESDSDEVKNVQKSQTSSSDKLGCMQKRRQPIKAKTGSKHVQPKINKQRISKKEDIIIIDSDTEDERDQNCNKKAKRKRLLFSGSVDSGDILCSQQKRHSPETEDSQCGTVKERFKKNRPSSADSPAPQHQSKVNESQFENLMADACPEQSHSTEKSGQLIEAKAGSEHVQHKINRQMISKKQSVIILNSDTEDESGHCYKKAKRKRLYLPGSADSGDAPCVQQKTHSLKTVETKCGTANEKLQEPRLSPADISVPQHQTKVHDTQLRNVMEDACSDLSHSMRKSGQLIEPKPDFEHIQHQTMRQTTSKKERTVFHGSETVVKSDHIYKKKAKKGSGNDLFATQNGLSTETVDRLSCEDSPEKQPLSVDKEVDIRLVPNPGILRLVVQKSSQPNKCLKLVKESGVHKEDNDETLVPKTLTATSKKSDSCDMNTPDLCRNKKGRFVSKPKPANQRHHETKNEVQANVTKPKLVSRQLSLPSQEGSTSTRSLSSTSGQFSEARRSSASSRGLSQSGAISASSAPPKSKQSPPIPRHLSSSKLQWSHSYSSPSTSDHPCNLKDPSSSANTQSSARKQVIKDWHNSYFPTRKDRKTSPGMEEDLTTTNDSQREARPGPSHYDRAPRQRHKSHEPPLMKKSMCEAKQLTNHRHRSVGEGYKWSEKPLAMPSKGSARKQKCRSSPRPHQ